MSQPDHVENTGDNLRHAAEVQERSEDDASPAKPGTEAPPPDFNT